MKFKGFTQKKWCLSLLVCLISLTVSAETLPYPKLDEMTPDEMTLVEAIQEISLEYGVYFSFDRALVKDILVNYERTKSRSLEEAVSSVLQGTGLEFKMFDQRYAIIYQKDKEGIRSLKKMVGHMEKIIAEDNKISFTPLSRLPLRKFHDNPYRQPKGLILNIEGLVKNTEGEPLIGVNVQVKGTTKGTATDFDGQFSLEDLNENAILVFSYIGYQTVEIPLDARQFLEVTMIADSELLDEVVVVGYGIQKKTNLTGAVSEINSEELELRSVNSATQALQGLAPNLNIDINASGGAADAGMNINIRGTGSLSNSSPYILINGVRASNSELAALNANDIASVSVLKDAASTAIYGAQAAYGVILIETKKGGKNQPFSINYSNSFRSKKRIFVPDFVNSVQYAEYRNVAGFNQTGQVIINEDQMERIRSYAQGKIEHQTEAVPGKPNQWLGIETGTGSGWYSGYANSHWWDIIFKDREFAQKHDVSASGGSENINYHISGSFFQDEGGLRYGDQYENFKRYNFDGHVSSQVTEWLMISNNTRFYQENNSFPATLDGSSRGRLYHDAMRFSPLAPYITPQVLDANGNVLVEEQIALIPGFLENNGFDAYGEDNFVTSFRSEVTLTDNLAVKGDFSFKKVFYDRTFNYKKWTLLGPDGKPSITYQANSNEIEKDIRKTDYVSFNIYMDYNKHVGKYHNFNLLAGYQQEENNYFRLVTSKRDVIADNLNSLNVAIGDVIGPNNPIETWSTLGFFGRLSYNFKEKYLFEFNGRYDGSSKFEDGDRFGFFPSASVGYNIHREDFWEPVFGNAFTLFKLRLSYGQLGNQNVGSYLYLSNIPINTRLPWLIDGTRPNYAGIPGIVSPDITWETSTTKNIGFDLAFFNSKLTSSIDIYERETDHMFGPSGALPAFLGTNPPQTNSASLKTKGWELTLGWRDGIGDFDYRVNILLSDNKSVITKYHNPNKVISNWYEGQVIGELWGFSANDLFQTTGEVEDYLSKVDLSYFGTGWRPGNVKYLDLDGDGKVNVGENTVENPGDRRVIGNTHPRYRISLNGGISWKGFDFDVLFQGVGKKDYMPSDYATLFWGWNGIGHSNVTEAVLDYWSEENPDAYLPIPLDSGQSDGFGKDRFASTRYLQDASYIRLKNLSLGYSIPVRILSNVPAIKGLKLYASGENLLTFTSLWENFDPELADIRGSGRIGDSRAYPLARTMSFGIKIQF